DVLINNAGLALGLAGAVEADLDHWDQMIDTNVRGLVHLTRHLLPKMKPLSRADIINISSVAGSYPYPGGNAYGGTKAFVKQFSLNLRPDLLGSNVRVTSVEPGMTETEFSNVRFEGDDAKADQVYQGMKPLKGADVARVITDILALPAHININRVEIMPVQQAFGPFAVARGD
ncbi:MAG: SDR family NAD(P)-dependent oxidoreductase, partial [Pseudomonadota bacterium]